MKTALVVLGTVAFVYAVGFLGAAAIVWAVPRVADRRVRRQFRAASAAGPVLPGGVKMHYRFKLVPGRDPVLYRWQRFTHAWTRACWFLSRQLGGRSVFGKRDETPAERLYVSIARPSGPSGTVRAMNSHLLVTVVLVLVGIAALCFIVRR